jgi:hypothetical protein
VPERASAVPTSTSPSEPAAAVGLPARNRRTAIGLVAWIVALMCVSALVAWFRN